MTITDIVLRNLRRRKAKAAFILAGLLIAVSTAVALLGLIEAMNLDIQHKLEEYGANILILPKTENLSLSYGGLSLGGVSFDMQEIPQAELVRCRQPLPDPLPRFSWTWTVSPALRSCLLRRPILNSSSPR